MSRPSSPIEVATRTLISPSFNFWMISFCSFWLKPVLFFLAWPKKAIAFIPLILFSLLVSVVPVSRNCVKIIIFEFSFSLNWFSTKTAVSSIFGCSIFFVRSS